MGLRGRSHLPLRCGRWASHAASWLQQINHCKQLVTATATCYKSAWSNQVTGQAGPPPSPGSSVAWASAGTGGAAAPTPTPWVIASSCSERSFWHLRCQSVTMTSVLDSRRSCATRAWIADSVGSGQLPVSVLCIPVTRDASVQPAPVVPHPPLQAHRTLQLVLKLRHLLHAGRGCRRPGGE